MIFNYNTLTILRIWHKVMLLIIVIINPYSCTLANESSEKIIHSDITILSDFLNIDNNNLIAHFKGTVTVIFDDLILKTDYLKIYYKNSDNKKSITKIEIPGSLKALKKLNNEIVIANSGEYIVALQKLTLKGNVNLQKDKYILVTDKMVYFTKFQSITKQNNEE